MTSPSTAGWLADKGIRRLGSVFYSYINGFDDRLGCWYQSGLLYISMGFQREAK